MRTEKTAGVAVGGNQNVTQEGPGIARPPSPHGAAHRLYPPPRLAGRTARRQYLHPRPTMLRTSPSMNPRCSPPSSLAYIVSHSSLFFHRSLSPLTLRHQASVVQHRCLRLVWSPSLPTLSSVYLHPHPLPPSPCCEKPPSCSADAAASAAAATRPSRTAGLPSTPETTLRLPPAPPAPKP